MNNNQLIQEESNYIKKKSIKKIPYKIKYISSEYRYGSVNEVINPSLSSKGWISAPKCKYPQELIIEFNEIIYLSEIQLISHQFHISSKIEIYINNDNSCNNNEKSNFKKYGYFVLRRNEDTNYQLRELKTITIDHQLFQIKLCLYHCYDNHFNKNKQVGIISLSCFEGEPYKESPPRYNQLKDYTDDEEVNRRIRELNTEKDKAVELEDYEKAKKIKTEIERLMGNSQEITKLNNKKTSVISDQDYDTLAQIQQEVDRVKIQMNTIGVFDKQSKLKQEQIPFQPLEEDEDINEEKKTQNNVTFSNKKDTNNNSIINDINLIDPNINKKRGDVKSNNYNNENRYQYEINKEEIQMNDNKQKMEKSEEENLKSRDQLQLKTKQIVNSYDEQKIGTHKKDFYELLDDKLNENTVFKSIGDDTNNNNDKENENEEIALLSLKHTEDLIPVLPYSIVKLLLSKKPKSIEKGLKQLIQEISNPNSSLFQNQTPESIVCTISKACSIVLTSKAIQPLFLSMDLIELLIKKYPHIQLQGFTQPKFDSYLNECIKVFISHLGHSNIDLRTKAGQTLLHLSNYQYIGTKPIYHQLLYNKIKQTSFEKQTCGRLNLISQMINHHDCLPSNISLSDFMNIAIQRYLSSNKEIQNSALNLIITIYKYTGESIREHFNQLKFNQITIIEESLINSSRNKDNNYKKSKSNKSNESNDNDLVNYNVNQKEQTELKELQQQQHLIDTTKNEKGLYCQHCNISDCYQTKDLLEEHYEKYCPMLIQCSQCKQIIEICGLNFHFTHECQNKFLFKICQRCKEPVLTDDYGTHRANNNCNPFNPPNLSNRCPLCHNDITPPGKIGWELHLLKMKCINNLRTLT